MEEPKQAHEPIKVEREEPTVLASGSATKVPRSQKLVYTQRLYETGTKLTVLETVMYTKLRGTPTVAEHRFTIPLTSDEQPYQRLSFVINDQWRPINVDWLMEKNEDGTITQNCGMIVFVNEEGRFLQTIPTDEERAEAAKKVILFRVNQHILNQPEPVPCMELRPSGDGVMKPSVRIEPLNLQFWEVRCAYGEARMSLHAYPR